MATHEIDAATATLTATLYIAKQTEPLGDEEDCIIVPKERNWRTLAI